MLVKEMILKEMTSILGRFDENVDRNMVESILPYAYHDLHSFAERDPSSKNDMIYILQTYKSYYAVLTYRISHYIYQKGNETLARKLSEYAKVYSGIEIHPGAQIDECFVLDHGVGTVIGETAIIGKRCYMLQDVILGAAHIAGNVNGQRHPIIGDDVEIGSFVRIYGSVRIGNKVKISPGAIIKYDVPDNSKIIVASNYQILQGTQETIYYTGFYSDMDQMIIFFQGRSLLEYHNVDIFVENTKYNKPVINSNSIRLKNEDNIDLKNIIICSNIDNLCIYLRKKGKNNARIN